MSKKSDEQILKGTAFRTRAQVAEEWAYISCQSEYFEAPLHDEKTKYLKKIEKLVKELGITDSEISGGRFRFQEREIRLNQLVGKKEGD